MVETAELSSFFSRHVAPWAVEAAVAVVLLVIGVWLAKKLAYVAERLMHRAGLDDLVRRFLHRVVYWVALVLVGVAVLEQLGVATTSVLAVLGAAGLAVGLAIKDSLSNVASGVMLVIFRPFTNGHYVEAGGVGGTVQEVGLFSTRLRTPDNRVVLIPNAEIYGGTITNYSATETRRIDLIFSIAYEDDIAAAKGHIREIIAADQRILTEPAAFIGVLELADSSVNIGARPWVNTSDYFQVKSDLLEGVKTAFDRHGISIPFPQQDVHLHRAASAG